MQNDPLELIYSYSQKDESLRDELEAHLSILIRQGMISSWHDRKIGPGKEWASSIDAIFQTAKIILLLVSPDFIASDYCYTKEMVTALERHECNDAIVIPIIIRPVDWKTAPFSKLLSLPIDGLPVTSWNNRDEAWVNVVEGIRNSIKQFEPVQ